jgi:hypothetical protein
MAILNILLLTGLIGLFCWLLFMLAVYALPLFVGAAAGLWAHGIGAGLVGGLFVGGIAASAAVIIGQLVFAFSRPLWLRLSVALLFAAPAAVAGYAATHGMAKHLVPTEGWQIAFSIIGAAAVGVTALLRLAGMAPPEISAGHRANAI